MRSLALLILAACVSVAPAAAESPAPAPDVEYSFAKARAPEALIGQAKVWTPAELGSVAFLLDADAYWLCPDPVWFLTDGMTRIDGGGYGDVMVGEVAVGVWANQRETSQMVLINPTGEPVTVDPGGVIAIGASLPWREMLERGMVSETTTTCSVTCRDSYYACCNGNGCTCRRANADGSDCTAGGPGAQTCTQTEKAAEATRLRL